MNPSLARGNGTSSVSVRACTSSPANEAWPGRSVTPSPPLPHAPIVTARRLRVVAPLSLDPPMTNEYAYVAWADWRPGERQAFFSAIKLQAFNRVGGAAFPHSLRAKRNEQNSPYGCNISVPKPAGGSARLATGLNSLRGG